MLALREVWERFSYCIFFFFFPAYIVAREPRLAFIFPGVSVMTCPPIYAGPSSAHIRAHAGIVRIYGDRFKILAAQERGVLGVVRVCVLVFSC